MQTKIKEWIRRYLPADIWAIFGAVGGGLLVNWIFHHPILTAFGATWGENFGYYGQIIYKEVSVRIKRDKGFQFVGMLKVLRGILFEFGAAEYLDSLLVRPVAMYFFTTRMSSLPLALLLGKLSADVVFYVPTIFFYELMKKYFKS